MRRSGLWIAACGIVLLACGETEGPPARVAREADIDRVMRLSGAYEIGIVELAAWSPEGVAFPDDTFAERVRAARGEAARERIWDSYSVLYDRIFPGETLDEVIAFYETDAGRQLGRIHLALLTAGRTRIMESAAPAAPATTAREETMIAMRAVAGVAWAYALDEDFRFPPDRDIAIVERRVEPGYIRSLPVNDGWGRPFRYVVSESHDRFRLVSAGADGTFTPESADWEWSPAIARAGDDLVWEDDAFLQAP